MHDSATAPPQGCGWCGRPLDEDNLVLATVADSSVIHPGDPARDGRRLILACGQQHLAALRERYESRSSSGQARLPANSPATASSAPQPSPSAPA